MKTMIASFSNGTSIVKDAAGATLYVSKVGSADAAWLGAFKDAMANGGKLCDELADLCTRTRVNGTWVIDWA